MAAGLRRRPIELEPTVRTLCERALDHCISQFKLCIEEQKAAIKGDYPSFDDVVDGFNWKIPAQGGKRKRRTMHRKRVNNRSRRNRRVH